MSTLIRDYLALPDVVFLREHWLALGLFFCAALLMVWFTRRRA